MALNDLQWLICHKTEPTKPSSSNRNAIELTQNICCVKGKGAVDRSTVTRWFDKFHSSYKDLDDQVGLKQWILMPYSKSKRQI